jgi:hypothetical protein
VTHLLAIWFRTIFLPLPGAGIDCVQLSTVLALTTTFTFHRTSFCNRPSSRKHSIHLITAITPTNKVKNTEEDDLFEKD